MRIEEIKEKGRCGDENESLYGHFENIHEWDAHDLLRIGRL